MAERILLDYREKSKGVDFQNLVNTMKLILEINSDWPNYDEWEEVTKQEEGSAST
jgi:hypothetical protein